jgi:hypothetical protein
MQMNLAAHPFISTLLYRQWLPNSGRGSVCPWEEPGSKHAVFTAGRSIYWRFFLNLYSTPTEMAKFQLSWPPVPVVGVA